MPRSLRVVGFMLSTPACSIDTMRATSGGADMTKHPLCSALLCLLQATLAFRLEARASEDRTGEPNSTVELFAGYCYLPETDALVRSFYDSGHGLAASVNMNFHKYVGLAIDFDTGSWTVHARDIGDFSMGEQRIRLSFLSIGPRFTWRRERFTLFGTPTMDYQRSQFSSMTIVDPVNPGNQIVPASNSNAWGLGFAGGIDLTLTKHIALRLAQINYSLGGFGEGPGRRLRIKTGIVLGF
jgi:hypothetical protein